MRPAHSPSFRWWVSAGLVLLAAVIALPSIDVLPSFEHVAASATAYHSAPDCTGAAGDGCVLHTSALIVNDYTTTGSKGALYYYVTFNGPALSGQTTQVSGSDYNRLPVGSEVPALVWHGSVVTLSPADSGGPITTDAQPIEQLRTDTIALLIPMAALILLAMAVAVLLSVNGPDDEVRSAVMAVREPPRPVPPGLRSAVVAGRVADAGLASLAVCVVVMVVYLVFIGSAVGVVGTAPVAMVLAIPMVSLGVYRYRYLRAVRDVTTGVFAEVPVNSETIIRGKNGPMGIQARYTLADGRQSSVRITRRWWRKVHPATRLNAIVSPSDGRIWRLLGMTDDNGRPVY